MMQRLIIDISKKALHKGTRQVSLSMVCILLAFFLLPQVACNEVRSNDRHPSTKSVMINDVPESLPWSERMALSVMKRNPESWMTDFRESPKWNYTQGLILYSILQSYQANGKKIYYDYARSYADTMITGDGTILEYQIDEYNIDHVNPGKILFQFYRDTRDDRYLTAMKTLRKQLQWQPRTTEGGYWHKLRYTWQMWLDGLYMGAPYYAQYAKEFNEPEAFDDIARQFILMEKKARDKNTGLLYHGWDESRVQRWANPETGCSPHFWGRAIGWYMMGLVDALEFFPDDHPGKKELINIFNRVAIAIQVVQDEETGLWYQILNMPDREGNYLEASASAMYTYAIAKGVNKGYLEKGMMPVAQKGFQGIIENLIEVGDSGELIIHQCCAVAGLGGEPYRDGSYEYYIGEEVRDNDTKATGPFILAALEFEKMGYEF